MRFVFGVIIGCAIGPSVYREVDKRYGDILIPHLIDLRARIEAWRKEHHENCETCKK